MMRPGQLKKMAFVGAIMVTSFLVIYTLTSNGNDAKEAGDLLKNVKREVREADQDLQQQVEMMSDKINKLTDTVSALQSELGTFNHRFNQSKYPHVRERNDNDRKRILVTGGAGFVGSHLVDELMQDGHEVTVIDNFFTGRKENVAHWIGHHNFELMNHDVVNPVYLEVDEIYHLASPASPPNYMYNPIKTIKTNTLGTINMLGLAKRVKAKFLLASTSEVYGDPEQHPQTEEYWGNVNPIGPRSCYDEAKRVAESMCYAYQSQEKTEVRVARIFNTFGPRMYMNDGRVVSNFILQCLQRKPITIYGDGKQTRSFQYVTDLVDGLISLMNHNYSLPVNLGNPEEHTIGQFAEIIKDLSGSTSNIAYEKANRDDPKKRKPDISLAKRVLNWEPKIKMTDGLLKTIDYFRKELKKNGNQWSLERKYGIVT